MKLLKSNFNLLFIFVWLVFVYSACMPSKLDSADTSVIRLSLVKQGIEHISDTLLIYSNLEYLYLNNNEIDSLPSDFFKLNNLKYINLAGNNLTYLPHEVAELQNLQYLILAGNMIDSVGNGLKQLTRLKVLDLSGNDVSASLQDSLQKWLPSTKILFEYEACVQSYTCVYNKAVAYANIQDYALAWKYCSIAQKLDPTGTQTHLLAGVIKYNLNQKDSACYYWQLSVAAGNANAQEYLNNFCK